MKKLIGCINNKSWKVIKTRFFLIDGNKIEDVTEKICKKVNEEKISNFKFNNGLANYHFGCGLSHYLQDDNLDKIGLDNTIIEMFTLNDVKSILNCKTVFDEDIRTNILAYNHIISN